MWVNVCHRVSADIREQLIDVISLYYYVDPRNGTQISDPQAQRQPLLTKLTFSLPLFI